MARVRRSDTDRGGTSGLEGQYGRLINAGYERCYGAAVAQGDDELQDDPLSRAMSAEEVAHLLRRTRFAAGTEDVAAWTGHSWTEAIATLVDNAPDPDVPTPAFAYRRPGPDGEDTDATLLLNSEIDRLNAGIGLGDRLLWFWHGVFTSSQSAVDQPVLLSRQHQLLARHSQGSLRQLIIEISTDPAMLIFLNGDGSSIDAPIEKLRARAHGAVHPGSRSL